MEFEKGAMNRVQGFQGPGREKVQETDWKVESSCSLRGEQIESVQLVGHACIHSGLFNVT